MEHNTQLIAERAQQAETGLSELINLLYNLHFEVAPNSSDADFLALTSFCYAADMAAKTGGRVSAPLPEGWCYIPGGQETEHSERATLLIQELRSRLEPSVPYADTIQETPLPDVEATLVFLGKQYYLFSQPAALRHLRLGLQERAAEYAVKSPAENSTKIARLQHAATWLHDYEKQLSAYLARPADTEALPSPAAPAKGTPAADVRRYFPDVATIHGSTATDANALHQLAVWLLHWAERHGHRLASNEYSLAGRLRKQQAAHPNAGKFLKACRRLHEALLPLAADEPGVKQLLGDTYGPHSRTNLTAVLKWWAGWLKEQQLTLDDPAGAYLAALRRVPVVEEWENGSPRYNLPTHLGIYDEFEAEITPLRQAFEAALSDLPTKKKRALRAGFNELLGIDRAGVQRRREQFERGEYGLDFLPADYPALRFDVAGPAEGFKWQWVSPMFWGGLSTLLQYKQQAAHAADKQLAATLPDTPPTASSLALSPTPPNPPISASKPILTPYFHISPEGIARQLKLRNEAHNAGRRQAMCNQLRKGLTGQQRENFENEKSQNDTNINTYSDWLETKLFYKRQALPQEKVVALEKAIGEEASSISTFLPYSDNYGPYFIKKLKSEPFLRVAEFLQFTREPWYAGLAGFYLLNKPDDIAYFRDLITEHLSQQPEDDSPSMQRAISWLNAEIERLVIPGSSAFRAPFSSELSSPLPEATHPAAPPKPNPAPDIPAEDSCYCRTHPNAETLADLPASCRIHEVIRGALPEIEKQIAARKLADTPAGFRTYCEKELARHVKNVGDMAKNLAHPTLYSEAQRPQMLELKLWNLTLCGLYKSELASPVLPRNSLAPDTTEPASPLLTSAATRTLYLKLLEHPALVGELTAYQKSELRAYAEAEQSSANETAVFLMEEWPNYNYPAEIQKGQEFDYWQAKVPNYADSGRVLHLLASPASASGLHPAAPITDTVTVASLCHAGLTPADLKELLVRLAVVDTTGKCLTNNLKGKAQGKRGAFTAAYRVLHRAGLLAPTTTDKEWAAAFKKEYEAELGTDVIAHKLTQHGQAHSRAPGPFQQAVTDATEWVSEWKSRRQS